MTISTTFLRMIVLMLSCSLLVVASSAFMLNHAVHRPIRPTSASSFHKILLLPSRSHRHPRQEFFHRSPKISTTNISTTQGLRPSSSSISNTNSNSNNGKGNTNVNEGSIVLVLIGIRNKLRQLTGFSISVIRASLRASTGFSLTAASLALRGFTGGIVTRTMKQFTSIFPSSVRYFMQPFLILYFTPIMILKSLCDRPTRYTERLASHQNLVNGWKNAVREAERVQNGDYWPVHVNACGDIEAVEPPSSSRSRSSSGASSIEGPSSVAITDAIVDSLDISLIDSREKGNSNVGS